jgi:hypothetical protein
MLTSIFSDWSSLLNLTWRGPDSTMDPALPQAPQADPHDVLRDGVCVYLRRSLNLLLWNKISLLLVFVPFALLLGATNSHKGTSWGSLRPFTRRRVPSTSTDCQRETADSRRVLIQF